MPPFKFSPVTIAISQLLGALVRPASGFRAVTVRFARKPRK